MHPEWVVSSSGRRRGPGAAVCSRPGLEDWPRPSLCSGALLLLFLPRCASGSGDSLAECALRALLNATLRAAMGRGLRGGGWNLGPQVLDPGVVGLGGV